MSVDMCQVKYYGMHFDEILHLCFATGVHPKFMCLISCCW